MYDRQAFFKLLLVPAVIAWAAKIWLTEYTKKEFVITVLLLCLGGGIYLISGEILMAAAIFMIIYFYGAVRIVKAGQGEVYEKGSDRK